MHAMSLLEAGRWNQHFSAYQMQWNEIYFISNIFSVCLKSEMVNAMITLHIAREIITRMKCEGEVNLPVSEHYSGREGSFWNRHIEILIAFEMAKCPHFDYRKWLARLIEWGNDIGGIMIVRVITYEPEFEACNSMASLFAAVGRAAGLRRSRNVSAWSQNEV